MKYIPIALTYSRVFIGFLVIALSLGGVGHYNIIAVFLLFIGLLTDVFDGIVARQLKISTEKLRRLDSTADVIFFICFIIATYIQCPGFFESNKVKLIVLIGAEALTYVVCFFKFRKEIATHSIGAKIWALTLFGTMAEVIFHCDSILLFNCCFWIGMVSRVEIIAIILILKKWASDVPTFYHAIKLRNGEEIKRHKLFNG